MPYTYICYINNICTYIIYTRCIVKMIFFYKRTPYHLILVALDNVIPLEYCTLTFSARDKKKVLMKLIGTYVYETKSLSIYIQKWQKSMLTYTRYNTYTYYYHIFI